MRNFTSRIAKALIIIAIPFALLACKVELYSGLREAEANEMLALLVKKNIGAEKIYGNKGGTVNLSVAKSDLAEAINVLKAAGLPREKFTNPAEVFTNDGLISSPMQENARYVYAISQTLAETLSQLDGVLTARVHIVLPDTKSHSRDKTQNHASAGVMIRHTKDFNVQQYTPQIKMLIMNAVEGITYENISIAYFVGNPAGGSLGTDDSSAKDALVAAKVDASEKTDSTGGSADSSSESSLPRTVAIIGLVVLVLGGIFWQLTSKKSRFGLPFSLMRKKESDSTAGEVSHV